METGSIAEVFANPQHPYTRSLFAALLDDAPTREDVDAAGGGRTMSLLDIDRRLSRPTPAAGGGSLPSRRCTTCLWTFARERRSGSSGNPARANPRSGRAVLGLAPVTGGTIHFDGEDITHAPRRARRAVASDIQVVFQDPYSSLSPSLTVGDTLAEPLRVREFSRRDAKARIMEALDLVHLPANAVDRLPREFSGGQRQRIAIARALVLEPRLIVCDEPVSALDLTTQSRVLDLFLEVQERTGVAYLFISHDLSVVRVMSHRVAVMKQGAIVETGTATAVTEHPRAAVHPTTAARSARRRPRTASASGAPPISPRATITPQTGDAS